MQPVITMRLHINTLLKPVTMPAGLPVIVSTVHNFVHQPACSYKSRKTEREGARIITRACERSVSGAQNGLNRPLKVRSHQHCVDLVTDILR